MAKMDIQEMGSTWWAEEKRKLGRVNSGEKKIQVEYIKAQLRSEAMRLFEADCPQQLVTDIGLGKRRKRETGTKDQVGKIYWYLDPIKSPLFVQVRAEVNEKARDRDPNPEEPELIDQQDSKGPVLKGIFSGMFQVASYQIKAVSLKSHLNMYLQVLCLQVRLNLLVLVYINGW